MGPQEEDDPGGGTAPWLDCGSEGVRKSPILVCIIFWGVYSVEDLVLTWLHTRWVVDGKDQESSPYMYDNLTFPAKMWHDDVASLAAVVIIMASIVYTVTVWACYEPSAFTG